MKITIKLNTDNLEDQRALELFEKRENIISALWNIYQIGQDPEIQDNPGKLNAREMKNKILLRVTEICAGTGVYDLFD